jgi:pimeloyl-ACP methyl ester carboxylesterase
VKRRTKLAGSALATGAALVAARAIVRRAQRAADPFEADPATVPAEARREQIAADDGGTIHYLETGDPHGRPLVLLHGITLRADFWAYQLRDLSATFRVIAPDLRGHGSSTPGTGGYGLTAMAADVATVLESLDLKDAIVVGHSMGGMALMQACADHPSVFEERVAGVVFLSTSAGLALPGPAARANERVVAAITRAGERRDWRLRSYGFGPNDLSYAMTRLAFGRTPSNAHIELTRQWVAAMASESLWPTGLSLSSHDGRAALAALKLPALVIVGSRDLLTPPVLARRIVALLANGRLEVLDGCGHQTPLERPAEIATLLTEFADAC